MTVVRSATEAETVANTAEIERLRRRSHEHGNALQEHAGHLLRVEDSIDDLDTKLDAIHLSLKEDLGEIKGKQDQTNGRVTALERRYSELRGVGVAVVAVTPFLLFALTKLIEH